VRLSCHVWVYRAIAAAPNGSWHLSAHQFYRGLAWLRRISRRIASRAMVFARNVEIFAGLHTGSKQLGTHASHVGSSYRLGLSGIVVRSPPSSIPSVQVQPWFQHAPAHTTFDCVPECQVSRRKCQARRGKWGRLARGMNLETITGCPILVAPRK